MTIEELQKEIKLHFKRASDGDVFSQSRLGWAYLQTGLYEEAQKWLKKAVDKCFEI